MKADTMFLPHYFFISYRKTQSQVFFEKTNKRYLLVMIAKKLYLFVGGTGVGACQARCKIA